MANPKKVAPDNDVDVMLELSHICSGRPSQLLDACITHYACLRKTDRTPLQAFTEVLNTMVQTAKAPHNDSQTTTKSSH